MTSSTHIGMGMQSNDSINKKKRNEMEKKVMTKRGNIFLEFCKSGYWHGLMDKAPASGAGDCGFESHCRYCFSHAQTK